jgi:diguanylate cyclase (GGDEF)-like protein
MANPYQQDRNRLIVIMWLLLTIGFVAISLLGYQVSRQAIRATIIDQDLPLTSSNIYSEIQKDLIRPVLVSNTMAHDTFVRDWILRGEQDPQEIARYLKEVRVRHGAFSSFLVSEKTGNYYTGEGVLKQVSPDEPRDEWYYRVRERDEDYEINVDPDLANADALTIFINYRIFDYEGHYIGATGVGLTVEAVKRLINEYQARFDRTIYFVDGSGEMVVFGDHIKAIDLRSSVGLGPLLDQIFREKRGHYQYQADGDRFILHVNFLPELNWYLFVIQNESVALSGIRNTLYLNLVISFVVTLLVINITQLVLVRYQKRLERLASTDELTGLLNRHASSILFKKLLQDYRREPRPLSVLLIDIDHFKLINDRLGHRCGDQALQQVGDLLSSSLRQSDLAVRWGGEEFLLLLKGCILVEAERLAEDIRLKVAGYVLQTDSGTVTLTLSIGVSEYDGIETLEQTIYRADAALYRAKHLGRNRVSVDPEVRNS